MKEELADSIYYLSCSDKDSRTSNSKWVADNIDRLIVERLEDIVSEIESLHHTVNTQAVIISDQKEIIKYQEELLKEQIFTFEKIKDELPKLLVKLEEKNSTDTIHKWLSEL